MTLLRPATWIALALAVAFSAAARANDPAPAITIGVSPPRFELELGAQPRTEAVRVFNFGTEPARIQGSVHTWNLDEQNELYLIEPTEQSLDQWMVINPLQFTIPPGGSQTVRFSIRPKVRPEPGEHRAIIYFEQLPTAGSAIQVRGRLGIGVYGVVGSVDRIGELHAVTVDPRDDSVVASFDISSLGSAHVRMSGQYAVWPSALYPGHDRTESIEGLGEEGVVIPREIREVGFLPSLPVLPATRHDLSLRLANDLPPGSYVLDINGDLSGKPLDMAVPFTVDAPDAERVAIQ